MNAVRNNLRAFYSASKEMFGRPIFRSEIIAVIEGTEGVDFIVSELGAPVIAAPTSDTKLASHQLPRVGTITINVA